MTELDAVIVSTVEKNAKKSSERIRANAEIVKIMEMDQIIGAGITRTPGLGIDGK